MNATDIAKRLGYDRHKVNGWTAWKHHTGTAALVNREIFQP